MATISGRKGAQIETELAAFIKLLRERNATSYLEVGGKFGDTFYRVMTSLPRGSRGVLVDLPPNAQRTETMKDSLGILREMGYAVQLILGNSHEQTIINEIAMLGPFDACLIDGDRTHEGIKADWLNFGPLCRMTAFHDVLAAGLHLAEKEKGMDVTGEPDMMAPVLWHEIQQAGFRTREIADPEEHVGIGVVFNDRKVRVE